MADFNVRSDSINVEQIMEQIRARIREKRGVDYSEQQIRELAAVELEKFLDPKGVRSDLLEEYRRMQAGAAPPAPPNYAFGEETLFETHRAPLRLIRRLLNPLLKLFWNPNPLIQALHIQADLNTLNNERETARRGVDQLHFEVLHNLVLETTRMGIEIKNLKMRVESLTGRLEFSERRARALESVVAYRPGPTQDRQEGQDGREGQERRDRQDRQDRRDRYESTPQPAIASTGSEASAPAPESIPGSSPQMGATTMGGPEGPGQRSRRRRRRRGRRRGGSAVSIMGNPSGTGQPPSDVAGQDMVTSSSPTEDAGSIDTGRSEPLDVEPQRGPSTGPEHSPSADSGHHDDQ